MKFTLEKSHLIKWDGIKAHSYSSAEDFAHASAIVFDVNGNHGKVKSKSSDRVYYVISGSGKFIVKDQDFQVEATDVIIVPQNTPYDYEGKMKLFLVHAPAFDPESEVIIEKKKGRNE